ncbi:hypothetical protein NUU61_001224 [Penicillium alfredii]|uniref:Uncharacterized protein n=1 Tax=Penicillium alfredii TaxID=1506179 RepID=A0A9W9GB34_9EURO|nr:uncharacterized protein NUU61_001224 [Penicillium alfredii]KAJ5115465.1 hypothetical protein NUU61_001224 [Penicillium alfredii]
MKLNLLALSTLLAVAAAADTTSAEPSTTTTSAEVKCAKSCDSKDLCCVAKCYKVPCPNDNQANDTNSCVSACPQGSGSPADTQKYAQCEQNCFSSHFFPANGAATTKTSTTDTTATGSAATETSSDSTKSSDSKTSSTSGSPTSSSGAAETSNAAANVKLGASAAGLFGLVIAAFAL